MDSVDIFQILIVTVGGGGLITAITIGYNTGRKNALVEARLGAIEDHFKEHGRVGLLWRFFEDGTLHSLRQRGVVRENSPMTLSGAISRASANGGIPRALFDKFVDMAHRAPQDNEGIVRFIIEELGWDTIIKDRAKAMDWPRYEYVYYWKLAIEEAHRSGIESVVDKLRPLVIE